MHFVAVVLISLSSHLSTGLEHTITHQQSKRHEILRDLSDLSLVRRAQNGIGLRQLASVCE